ncbi:MAG: vWA domain-containing protein [Nanobdellota archaeon]
MIHPNIGEKENIEEVDGKLGGTDEDDKLMRSVLSNDKEKIDEGKMISDAVNRGLGSFTPDIMFENLVEKYQMTKKMYGERLIRNLTGYDADYVERNRNIPEFRDELKKQISSRIKKLEKDELIDEEGMVTDYGLDLSSVIVYLEELEHLKMHGISGEKIRKEKAHYGEKAESKDFRRGDRYKDIDVRGSVKKSIKRGHDRISRDDLKVKERQSKGNIEIIYAIDASASMKGEKLEMAKKAGIALAYKATQEKNKVGLIVFGDEIREEFEPSNDFEKLLYRINRIRATNQTNISKTINRAGRLFSSNNCTKHLMMITDAMPTEGEDPHQEAIDSAAELKDVTTSIIGINLNEAGTELARKITDISEGRLSIAKNINNLDLLVLEDYSKEK